MNNEQANHPQMNFFSNDDYNYKKNGNEFVK